VTSNTYNFEGSSTDEQRVYGIHYDGTLLPSIGSDRQLTTATNCYEHSTADQYIQVTKDACFDCESSTVFSTHAPSPIDICASDTLANVVHFGNSLGLQAGANYVYLITDTLEILQQVIAVDSFDFEGSVELTQRVYGLHYDGDIDAAVGSPRLQTVASGCFEHSSSIDFIEVTKDGCFECLYSSVSINENNASLSICPSDGTPDIVYLENSLDTLTLDSLAMDTIVGVNYAYLITDTNEVIQNVVLVDSFDFEGGSNLTQRIYGIHYDGTLTASVDSLRSTVTATGCYQHSSDTTFVTITKDACFVCQPSEVTVPASTLLDICPTDSTSDIITLDNSLGLSAGEHYAYLITDTNEILQEVVLTDTYDFEGSGESTQRVYGIHFDGTLSATIGSPRLSTTADGCYEHSSATQYIEVTKNACFVCEVRVVSEYY